MKKKSNFSRREKKMDLFSEGRHFNMNYINFGQFRCDIHSVAGFKKKKVNVWGFKLKPLLINFCRSLSPDSCPPGGGMCSYSIRAKTRSWFTDPWPRVARAKCHIPIWISGVSDDNLLAELRNKAGASFWIASGFFFFPPPRFDPPCFIYTSWWLSISACRTLSLSLSLACTGECVFAKARQSPATSSQFDLLFVCGEGLPSTKRVKDGIINPAAAPDVAFVCRAAYLRCLFGQLSKT